VFSWKGKELMSVSDEIRPLPEGYQSAYLRWMRYGFGGHPKIYGELGKRAGVPASVRILKAEPPPGQPITLRVTNIATGPDAPYSLAGFTHVEPDKQPYKVLELFPADRKTAFAARVAAAKKDRDDAVAEGRMLDAALAHFAYSLASGDTSGDWFAQTRDQVAADTDTRLLVASLSAKDAEQASAAVKALQGLRAKDTSPYAYMLDLFAANHEMALKHPAEAERLFTAALASNPYLTGAWFDLAKLYYGTFHVQEAWACWDAARSINPAHPFAKEIDTLERDLVADHSEFF
jgi:tetratricopeptide (TPR) repeat protein